jgi:hypothetical protein
MSSLKLKRRMSQLEEKLQGLLKEEAPKLTFEYIVIPKRLMAEVDPESSAPGKLQNLTPEDTGQ